MSKLLLNKSFLEHSEEDISYIEDLYPLTIFFKQMEKQDCKCIEVIQNGSSKKIISNFYIGADWLKRNKLAIYVAPKKLNDNVPQTDYMKMLFSYLKHPDVISNTEKTYEIKFNEPSIEIEQTQDLITPLLIVHFLQLLKIIVRKGLKKSYYKVEHNLNGKIKGKVLVSQTLKQNIIKNKLTKTLCQFDTFGYNTIENRILKRTLLFVKKYIAFSPYCYKLVSDTVNYCQAAFSNVDDDIELKYLKDIKYNIFFKEYKEALHISSLLLRRFGYNIKSIDKTYDKIVKIPPFWIKMPILFELYVFGLLKEKYHNYIKYQIQGSYGQPDFILATNSIKMIIDAKYRPTYQEEHKTDNIINDIRQISGYARDKKILTSLGFNTEVEQDRVIDCLIIYPDQTASMKLSDNLKENTINGFTKFYKMALKLPTIEKY
ncbi:MAG: hypothetical protein AB7E39_04035 [Endomicrobiaceae bacterium]